MKTTGTSNDSIFSSTTITTTGDATTLHRDVVDEESLTSTLQTLIQTYRKGLDRKHHTSNTTSSSSNSSNNDTNHHIKVHGEFEKWLYIASFAIHTNVQDVDMI
jgi:hypothetical protein